MRKYLLLFLMCVTPCFATDYYAQMTGNINAVGMWDPVPSGSSGNDLVWSELQPEDTLDANGETITINVTGWTCTNINTTHGGNFTYNLTGDNTINCDVVAGTTTCLTLSHLSGNSLTVKDVIGGNELYSYGVRNDSTGSVIITTNSGGSEFYAYGVLNADMGSVTIITNNGGRSSYAHGVLNASTGSVIITTNSGGSEYFASGVTNESTGIVTITTNSGGSVSSAYGVLNASSGIVTITNLIFDETLAAPPTSGRNIFFDFGTVTYQKTDGGDDFVLEAGGGSTGATYGDSNAGGLYGP